MRSLWTDTVTVDYGGLFPLEGQVDADTLKEAMTQVIGAIPVTQHMVTGLVADIDGDTAEVRFHLEALHHHPGLTDWTLYARNVIGLTRTADGWKVSSERLTLVHQTGNIDFVSELTRLMAGQRMTHHASGAASSNG